MMGAHGAGGSGSPEGVRLVEHPPGAPVPEDEQQFLDELCAATIIKVPGGSSRPSRVVAGLLHGNEPSGLRAIHQFLRQLRAEDAPAMDCYFFLGAVEAARLPPRLTRRRLPEGRDLNRCFRPPFSGREGLVAESALGILRAAAPEAVLDLHNNTGRNPAYGVVTALDGAKLALTSLFAPRVVWSQLSLGTFSESWDGTAPAVTIECGQAGTAEADATALAGLQRFLRLPAIDPHYLAAPMEVFASPVQVKLRSGVGLAFARKPITEVELTLDPELDRHNFQTVPTGETIGWVTADPADGGSRGGWPFEAFDESGRECSRDYLVVDGGVVRTARSFVPIMATTNARIAADDCLFYATTRRE